MFLFMLTVKFCGHVLHNGTRKACASKLDALRRWCPEVIKTVTHLEKFLGLAQYYAMYMKNYATVAIPLSRQLKARTPDDLKIVWDDSMKLA